MTPLVILVVAGIIYLLFTHVATLHDWETKEWYHLKHGVYPKQGKGLKRGVKHLRDYKVPADGGRIPDAFDCRTAWPRWASEHLKIRAQGLCGSCTGFAVGQALGDRLFIHSKGNISVELSPMYVMACDRLCSSGFLSSTCDEGCNGNILEHVWTFARLEGLIEEKCMPYDWKVAKQVEGCGTGLCGAHGEPTHRYTVKDAYYCGKYMDGAANVPYMQAEIMARGPITVTMEAYDDFETKYHSGVYHKLRSSKPAGGHAVRVIGWGVEDKTPYWICANQWSTEWGEHGFFRIRRGTNECGIEDTPCVGIQPSMRLDEKHPK